ncbi:AAA family ATPase [Desulfomonile tiedjei]|uniref:AAA+ family ATPase n=1 Tax=Desulfomonile tiedjei (strain ATCC 49306 / DSM 6799 / DCB-1) TaxID=706587 RepID=I4C7I9_DESTA|nr:AAA family ATPase [Desulfomonile tiedjei]AFM25530.1 AAA+ family ATPase [Desulfomonile tiedjei DSM 6799]
MNENGPEPPEFARKIKEKYVSSQSNAFIIYGNTKDIYPVSEDRYVNLVDFLVEALIKPDKATAPRIVLLYDPATGISFLNPLDRQLLANIMGETRLRTVLESSRGDVIVACAVMRELTRFNVMVPKEDSPGRTIRKDFAIIIRYAEAVAPPFRGDVALDSDRLKIITLENWLSDSGFIASPDIVFMTAETLNGINERIVDLPYCSAIKIDRPKEEERKRYIEYLLKEENVSSDVSSAHLAYSSAGLTLLSIRQIFRQAAYKGNTLTPDLIFEKSKEIIEKELEGHIEFPNLAYGFEKVIGASRLLKKLNELKACLRGSDPDIMPVGILVPGANGVGKTFIYKAFAKECGWIAVVLKNIRGPYVGQTEKNWERIRSVLEAMGNVMVIYDEADTEIGGRSAQTHDVDRRLFGNILKMMSADENRGRIVWIIITARPDRLEPDIKRSGRAGEHLPVFASEGEEKEAFVKHVLSQAGVDLVDFSSAYKEEFLRLTHEYFPADFDQLVTELKRRRVIEGSLSPEMVLEEAKDFIPSDIARQREYQELLAVLECTSREILPDRYATVSKELIQDRLQTIRMLIGQN